MAFRALILDFDGLMVDTEWPSFLAWQQLYEEHGATLDIGMWAQGVGAAGLFDPLAHLEVLVGQPVGDRAALLARRDAHKAALVADAPLMPGVQDRIVEARALGWGVAVASSSSSAWVCGHLERLGFLSQIDAVRTRDHVRRVKPDPEVYRQAAQALQVEPGDCVVCEDSLNGVRAARAAGMFVIAVPNAVTRCIDFQGEADLCVGSLSVLRLGALRRGG